MAYLLIDTNIVSYLYKDDSRKNLYTPLLQNQQLVISIITFFRINLLGRHETMGHSEEAATHPLHL